MGQTLNPVTVLAFADELEKIAGPLVSFAKNVGELGSRVLHPIEGVAKGWKSMAPAATLAHGGEEAAALSKAIAKTRSGGVLRRAFGAGTHLDAQATPVLGGGLRQGAEQLSRAGWTGKGAITKYLPLGEKAQMVGMGPAFSLPALMNRDTDRGQEIDNTLGFTGAGVLAAGTGVPGVLATLAAGHYAGKAGHRIGQALGSTPKVSE